tara:strand:- start:1024 stop:2838 length:1815 start_codon:yes stop_codon:yes gene_type:complete
MNILSITRGHNSSTTLMVDGEIVFYIEEERLSRFKYDGNPFMGMIKASEYVDHIDHFVVCHTHPSDESQVMDWTQENYYEGFLRKLFRHNPRKNDPIPTSHITRDHHELHAACGYFNSGFDTAACVIVDGAGSFIYLDQDAEWVSNTPILKGLRSPLYEFETIFHVDDPSDFTTVYKNFGSAEPIGWTAPGHSLFINEYPGIVKMYEAVTQYCGFPAIEAGKLMGLSSYGKSNKDIPNFFNDGFPHGLRMGNRELILPTYPNAAVINFQRYDILVDDINSWHEKKTKQSTFELEHNPEDTYTNVQKDLAYAIQEESSDAVGDLIEKAAELTGEKNIVICGGYGLNCVANYKYAKRFPDLNIYCEPISHDGGTSIGGAKKVYYELTEGKCPSRQSTIYYGPKYDPKSYEKSIKDLDVSDTSYEDVAELIRDGNIVTIFQGRSEAGPRALGNRSILFDPTIKDGKDIVNKVKNREFFRPFACSILKEKVHDWFDLAGMDESPSMMYAVDCLPGVEEKIPSVIHVDGTCRIQTVTKEQNEHYYNLISAFEKLSDTPILFNTSFNLGGDPLVETIDDALDTLHNSQIEYLYLPELNKIVKIPNSPSCS